MAKNKEIVEEGEMLGEGSGPRVYELGFHLDPELPTEEVKKAYQSIKSAVEAVGAIVAEGEPMQVALAYTISRQEPSGRRDFNNAYFCWVAYECDSSKHAAVLEAAKDPRIIRFIDLVTTKDAARHAAEMREFAARPPEREEAPADASVSETELDAALADVAV